MCRRTILGIFKGNLFLILKISSNTSLKIMAQIWPNWHGNQFYKTNFLKFFLVAEQLYIQPCLSACLFLLIFCPNSKVRVFYCKGGHWGGRVQTWHNACSSSNYKTTQRNRKELFFVALPERQKMSQGAIFCCFVKATKKCFFEPPLKFSSLSKRQGNISLRGVDLFYKVTKKSQGSLGFGGYRHSHLISLGWVPISSA